MFVGSARTHTYKCIFKICMFTSPRECGLHTKLYKCYKCIAIIGKGPYFFQKEVPFWIFRLQTCNQTTKRSLSEKSATKKLSTISITITWLSSQPSFITNLEPNIHTHMIASHHTFETNTKAHCLSLYYI